MSSYSRTVDRRSFLQGSLACGAAALLPAPAALMHRASVADFGADPKGEADATAAVRRAIASLARKDARLVFPPGRYRFQASYEAAMQFVDFDGIEVYANNAELVFAGKTVPFVFRTSNDVAVHDVKVEWEQATAVDVPSASAACFRMEGCQGVLLDGVTVRHAPATAFVIRGCRDVKMEGVSVTALPGPKVRSLPSAGIDGLCCSDSHGSMTLKDVHFDGIAGDAINIYQSFWKIVERSNDRANDRTIVIAGLGPRTPELWELPAPGDFIQFSSPSTLALFGEIGVDSLAAHPDGASLTLSETLSSVIVPGMLVCGVVYAPRISVEGVSIANALGRGIVVHSRAEITKSSFVDCAGEAIVLAPDRQTMQGPAIQNVRIQGNRFENCGSGHSGRGVIAIDTAQFFPVGAAAAESAASTVEALPLLNSSIRIQGNAFIQTTGPAIYAASVIDLVVEENVFQNAPLPQGTVAGAATGSVPVAIAMRDVSDSRIANNISDTAQQIVMRNCAATVAVENNRMLTIAKLG